MALSSYHDVDVGVNVSSRVLDEALQSVARGWVVGPAYHPTTRGCSCREHERCTHVGKHPIGRWPRLPLDEAAAVKRFKDKPHNLLMFPGLYGCVIIDIDPRHGGSRRGLEDVVGKLPETATVITGSGGEHLHF